MGEMDIKQRLTYIDIARAIGILFVVLGHVNQFYRDSQGIENSQTLIFIYAFHMPLFFILSGILFSAILFLDTRPNIRPRHSNHLNIKHLLKSYFLDGLLSTI